VQGSQRAKPSNGFSLVELVIVLVTVLVVAGFAVPNIQRMMADVRLRGSASDFSALLQRTRLASVQNNATYTVRFLGSPLPSAYADLNNNSALDTGEPMIQFGQGIFQVSAPNGSGGNPTALDGPGGPLGWTATAGSVSFNPRGLPCDVTKSPCGTNVGYVFYLSDQGQSRWAAVSVTAAGRIKVWTWSGTAWAN
jgi:Tfp pilus assembly protein FimT